MHIIRKITYFFRERNNLAKRNNLDYVTETESEIKLK